MKKLDLNGQKWEKIVKLKKDSNGQNIDKNTKQMKKSKLVKSKTVKKRGKRKGTMTGGIYHKTCY